MSSQRTGGWTVSLHYTLDEFSTLCGIDTSLHTVGETVNASWVTCKRCLLKLSKEAKL